MLEAEKCLFQLVGLGLGYDVSFVKPDEATMNEVVALTLEQEVVGIIQIRFIEPQ